MKNKRVVFIVGTLGNGGVERQLYYMVDGLLKLEYQIEIICLSKGEYWEKKIKNLGIKISFCGEYRSRLFKLFFISKIIKTKKVDIIYSTHFYTNLYATIIGNLFKISSISSVRSDFKSEQKALGVFNTYIGLKFSSATISNSKIAISIGKKSIKNHNWEYLPNAIDTKYFNLKNTKSVESKNHKIKILMVSRLTKEKRVDFFLELISELKSNNELGKNIIAFVAGSGRQNEDLSLSLLNMAKRLQLNKNEIQFLGEVDDMAALYHSSDLLVLTSEREGAPNCILEAMSCGLPVIANNVGGVEEIVKNYKNGFKIDAFDKPLFLEKLIYLLNNDNMRLKMGLNGRDFVQKYFSIDNNIKKLNEIFKTITS